MLLNYGSNLPVLVIASLIMIIALVLHNIVQAYLAHKLGDSTAKMAGFTRFEPMLQLDMMGLVLLLILGFGWSRPIPVNSRNFPGRGRKEAWIWLSGIGVFLAFGFLSLILAVVFANMNNEVLYMAFAAASGAATLHAVVHLIPVLPLDMARAALAWGNPTMVRLIRQVAQFGPLGFLIFFMVLNFTGVLGAINRLITSGYIWLISIIPGL